MRFEDDPTLRHHFIEPSYVYAPHIPIKMLGNSRRGWYVKAKLLHHDNSHETWEFAEGDLVKHISDPERTVGVIAGIKQGESGGPFTVEKYEMYDVVWGDTGPAAIQKEEINVVSRKLRAKWSPELAPDLSNFKLPPDWTK